MDFEFIHIRNEHDSFFFIPAHRPFSSWSKSTSGNTITYTAVFSSTRYYTWERYNAEEDGYEFGPYKSYGGSSWSLSSLYNQGYNAAASMSAGTEYINNTSITSVILLLMNGDYSGSWMKYNSEPTLVNDAISGGGGSSYSVSTGGQTAVSGMSGYLMPSALARATPTQGLSVNIDVSYYNLSRGASSGNHSTAYVYEVQAGVRQTSGTTNNNMGGTPYTVYSYLKLTSTTISLCYLRPSTYTKIYKAGTTKYSNVTSTSASAYPDNGYQDGYYYIKKS